MKPKVHELKTHPSMFQATLDGRKTFEYRREDRGFDVGSILRLREWSIEEDYTGRELRVEVIYVLCGPAFGVPRNYVVMSLGSVLDYAPGEEPEASLK